MQRVIDTLYTYISPAKIQVLNFVDRCCTHYTPILLIILMFLTGTIDIYGSPLNCMLPQEFSEIWANFVHQYCYVTGTYIKHYDNDGDLQRMYVDYYQWVPFLLLAQLLIMRFPNIIWRYAQTKTDIDFSHMHTLCLKIRSENAEKRLEHIDQAAKCIFKVAMRREFHGIGNKLLDFYVFFKLLNILTVILVISLLYIFVGKESIVWGLYVFKEMLNRSHGSIVNAPQHHFKYFPRVAYCEFGRDFLGHLDGQLIQETRCTLGINMLNEKVFLVLYFWYHLLLAIAIADPLLYFFNCGHCQIKELLQLVNRKEVSGENEKHIPVDEKNIRHFSQDVLGRDGLLLFRFLNQSVGKLIASEICSRLYVLYKTKDDHQHRRQQCASINIAIAGKRI